MECNAVNCIYYDKGRCRRSAVALMELAQELSPPGSFETEDSQALLRDQKGCYSGAVNLARDCSDFQGC